MRLDQITRDFVAQIIEDTQAFAQTLGYSPEMIAWGFDHMFAHWTTTAWAQFFEREIPDIARDPANSLCDTALSDAQRAQILARLGVSKSIARRVALIPASTVPSAVFQEICQILTLPVELTVRPPQTHRQLYEVWKSRLTRFMPQYAARLILAHATHCDDDTRVLCASNDVVCVSGADATVAHYRAICARLDEARRPRLVEHGHRLSAMMIDARDFSQLTDDDYHAMAIDNAIWDQTGCLSPKFAFIEADFDAACAFADKLTQALDGVAKKLPPLAPDIAIVAQKNSALLFAMTNGAYVARSSHGDAVAVYPLSAPFEPVFFPRLLQVFCTENAARAVMQLKPRGQQLASRRAISNDDRSAFAKAGFNLFCTFGAMQNPPLTWFHDNIGTLTPLFGD